MLIDILYFVFACSSMAQREDVIMPGDPYGSGIIGFNKGLQA